MAISFVDGVLVIDEEINLTIPTPLDIPVPTPPVVPSFDFPPIPDVAGDLVKLKLRLDDLSDFQLSNPSFNLSSGGYSSVPGSSQDGGSGQDIQEITEIPSSSINFDNLKASINIQLPTPPVVPSFDFPPIPDVAGDLVKIKSNLDYLKSLQDSNPDIVVNTGGGQAVSGSGGESFDVSSSLPSSKLDFDLLASSINIQLPTPPVVPSFDFPPIPDPTSFFGNIGVDPDVYKKSENNESSPGYSPTAPKVSVSVYINGIKI
jgi:hypothetical protein